MRDTGLLPTPRSAARREVLNLGHGAGALPGLLHRAGALVTSVDLDADVARVAPCFGYTGDVTPERECLFRRCR